MTQDAADRPGAADGREAGQGPVPAVAELAFDVEDLPGGAAAAIEAVLMVADEPLPAVRLAAVLGLPTEQVQAELVALAAEYRGVDGGRPRGFELRETGPGWRIYSAPAYAD